MVQAKAQKTVSLRLEAADYNFPQKLGGGGQRGSVHGGSRSRRPRTYALGLGALSRRQSLAEQGAEVASLPVSEMMDVLAEHGIASDLRVEDYRESLQTLREVW